MDEMSCKETIETEIRCNSTDCSKSVAQLEDSQEQVIKHPDAEEEIQQLATEAREPTVLKSDNKDENCKEGHTVELNIHDGDSENTGQVAGENITDEYHYLKTGEYTSENFKVVVHNIPSLISFGRFRGTVQKLIGFKPHKTKYNRNQNYAFLAFRNDEERMKAINTLHNYSWNSNVLTCKKAAPVVDPFVRERKRKGTVDLLAKLKELDKEEGLSNEERILRVVCPYWSLTYEEQLKRKQESMLAVLQRMTTNMKSDTLIDTSWIGDKEICVELEPIIPSPETLYYRNKVEFTIGKGEHNLDNCVGFRLGAYKEGSILIVKPTKCTNCPKLAMDIAEEFENFIHTLNYPSFCVATHVGLWQQLAVRVPTTNEIMVNVQVNYAMLSQIGFKKLEDELKVFLSERGEHLKITSAFLSSSSERNHVVDLYKNIWGKDHIMELMGDLKFKISPAAFFQVNTKCAELLYEEVFEWCNTQDASDSIILDLCCGTGTIGIHMAKRSKLPVLGIEICEQAVNDARHNAKLNGIENARFVCGAAETVLHSEMKNIKQNNVMVVVDPPRAGLHKDVLRCIRACSRIKKIVYISCSPKQAADNFIAFCRKPTKRRLGTPFCVVRARTIDLFPQTPHCELIVALDRSDNVYPSRKQLAIARKKALLEEHDDKSFRDDKTNQSTEESCENQNVVNNPKGLSSETQQKRHRGKDLKIGFKGKIMKCTGPGIMGEAPPGYMSRYHVEEMKDRASMRGNTTFSDNQLFFDQQNLQSGKPQLDGNANHLELGWNQSSNVSNPQKTGCCHQSNEGNMNAIGQGNDRQWNQVNAFTGGHPLNNEWSNDTSSVKQSSCRNNFSNSGWYRANQNDIQSTQSNAELLSRNDPRLQQSNSCQQQWSANVYLPSPPVQPNKISNPTNVGWNQSWNQPFLGGGFVPGATLPFGR